MRKAIEMQGKKFGKLTVISYAYTNTRYIYWLCKCECGNEKLVEGRDLRSGNTKSCGCLKHSHKTKNRGISEKKPRQRERLYKAWCNMKSRCYNENSTRYDGYGGRGIIVCDEWKNNYESFKKWSLENGYSDNLTIDRINNDSNYEPHNCRWVSNLYQQNNKRNNIIFYVDGEKITLSELCRRNNLKYIKAYNDLKRGIELCANSNSERSDV